MKIMGQIEGWKIGPLLPTIWPGNKVSVKYSVLHFILHTERLLSHQWQIVVTVIETENTYVKKIADSKVTLDKMEHGSINSQDWA